MRLFITLLLALAASCPAAGQLLLWEHHYGTDSTRDFASAAVVTPAGYLVVGHSCNQRTGAAHRDQLYGFLTDSVGTLLWSTTGRTFYAVEPMAVQPMSTGGVVIVGRAIESPSAPDSHPRLYVARWSGGLLDEMVVGEVGWEIARATPLVDGGFIVSGSMGDSLLLAQVSNDGSLVWSRLYGLGGISYLVGAPGPTADGGFVATGAIMHSGVGSWDAFLLRVDADGNELWWRDIGSGELDEGCAVAQRPDGGFLVVLHARTERVSKRGPLVYLTTNGAGEIIHSARVSDYPFHEIRGIVPCPDGYVAVGSTGDSPSTMKMLLLKFGDAGIMGWIFPYGLNTHQLEGRNVVPLGADAFLVMGRVEDDAILVHITDLPTAVGAELELPDIMDLW